MTEILQAKIPDDMRTGRRLPGIQPLTEPWVRVDDAYAAQMAHRRHLIEERRADVYWQSVGVEAAAQEVLEQALTLLPDLGFEVTQGQCRCPDGHVVDLASDAPLAVLGQLIQEDICLMDKEGEAHVLVAANLCFPAGWRLSEKAGQPLIGIHAPVSEYDADLARRVQRLFDGVQAGRPLWRYNRLWYDDPELHQPRSEQAPRQVEPDADSAAYQRAERQCVVRLPQTGAVVFSIHTYVVKPARDAPL